MKRILVNEVMLGKRSIGYELYSVDNKDFCGMTSKQVKDSLTEGKPIIGFKLDSDGQLVTDEDFCKNLMLKSGISTLTPKDSANSIINMMYTVVGKVGTDYEVVSSRFFRGTMEESKLKMLYELGAVNGVTIDSKGKLQVYQLDKPVETIENKVEITADMVL